MTALTTRLSISSRWRKRLNVLIVAAAAIGIGIPATGWVCALTKASDTGVLADMRAVSLLRYLCRCTYSHCLPPDEAILAHYEKHKSTFDEVVRRIRWDWGGTMMEWNGISRTRPEIRAILDPLDVAVDLQGTWPAPSPAGFPTNIREYDPKCKACNAEIRFGFGVFDKGHVPFTQYMYVMASVAKAIVVFPYEPMMMDGKLITPSSFEYGLSSRLVTNLDEAELPEYLGQCVYRHIEGTVFLRMCAL